MATVKVEKISEPCKLGEGPHWDHEQKVLYFVDIEGLTAFKYDPATQTQTSVSFAENISFIIPIKGEKDKFAIGLGHKVAILTWDGKSNKPTDIQVIVTVDEEEGKETNRINDGKADPSGRLWTGTMGPMKGKEPTLERGIMFSLKDKKAVIHLNKVNISNGLAWSSDNKTMYYIDSICKSVDAFDFDIQDGKISNRRKIFDFNAHNVEGFPDGQTIDNDGNLWVACFGGSQVLQIEPKSGKLLQRVEIPALNVTSVTFGGENLNELFVTTAFEAMTQAELDSYPLAGCTFRVTGLGAKGFPGQSVVI